MKTGRRAQESRVVVYHAVTGAPLVSLKGENCIRGDDEGTQDV
jgi:hypothetical protein